MKGMSEAIWTPGTQDPDSDLGRARGCVLLFSYILTKTVILKNGTREKYIRHMRTHMEVFFFIGGKGMGEKK